MLLKIKVYPFADFNLAQGFSWVSTYRNPGGGLSHPFFYKKISIVLPNPTSQWNPGRFFVTQICCNSITFVLFTGWMTDRIKSVCNYYLLERVDNLLKQNFVANSFFYIIQYFCGNIAPVSMLYFNNDTGKQLWITNPVSLLNCNI